MDCDPEEAFDVGIGLLYQRWEKLSPGFHKWFLKTQTDDVFRCHMIKPVHECAQLGSPPVKFTNNPNESSNSVVKHWTGFKNSWPAFIQKLQKLVESQLSVADKAIYGAGEYSVI